MKCPLCEGAESEIWDQDKTRSYHRCLECTLIYVPRDKIISPLEEFKRYSTHQNNEGSASYVEYLRKTVRATLSFVNENMNGLDFGCGESTIMAKLYGEELIPVDSYDLYFHPSEEIWTRKYHFIMLSEVIEHLATPNFIMKKIRNLLESRGQLFIKTKFYPEKKEDFPKWFYKRDPTHIQFFSENSMKELASHLGMKGPEQIGEDLYRFLIP